MSKNDYLNIKDKLAMDMKAALTARDSQRLGTLRLIRAELLNAEKETGEAIDDARIMKILQKMVKQRRDSIEQYEQAGREDLAQKERDEQKVIEEYLPQALSEEEIEAVVDDVLAEQGQPDPKQMGKIMGIVMQRLNATGKPFDGKGVHGLVRHKMGM